MQHTQLLATNVMLAYNVIGLETYVDDSIEMLVSMFIILK